MCYLACVKWRLLTPGSALECHALAAAPELFITCGMNLNPHQDARVCDLVEVAIKIDSSLSHARVFGGNLKKRGVGEGAVMPTQADITTTLVAVFRCSHCFGASNSQVGRHSSR